MELDSKYIPAQNLEQTIIKTQWDAVLARLVSHIFSPPLLVIIGVLLAAWAIGGQQAWLWGSFYAFFAVIIPILYIVWQVETGKITDFHIKMREQRIKPMLVMVVCSILSWLVMLVYHAPYPLVVFAGIGVIQVVCLLLITLRWKISGHSAAAAGFSMFIFALFGPPSAPVLLLIPLVAWARIRRNRHELSQTIAGSLAGIVYMVIVLYFVNSHGAGLAL